MSSPIPAPSQSDSQLERYQALLDIGDIIHACRDLEELFSKLSMCVRRVIDLDGIAVNLLDEQQGSMRVTLLETKQAPLVPVNIGLSVPLEGVPAVWVLEHQRVMRLRVTDNDPKYLRHNEFMRRLGIGATFTFPLTTPIRKLGVLFLAFIDETVDLPESELRFLQRVVDQVALAVENALQFDQVRAAEREVARERDRTRLLLEVNNAVVSNLSLPDLLKSISASLHRITRHDAAFILLYDANKKSLRVQALDTQVGGGNLIAEGTTIPIEGTPEEEAIVTRQPVLIRSDADFKRFPSPLVQKARDQGVRSGCNAPLIARDRPLGVLVVISRSEGAFSSDDAELLGQCAGQIAIAVDNALAYEEIATLKDRLAQEKLYLEDEIRSEINVEEIVGDSTGLRTVLHRVQIVAPSSSTVLILGETGTGKELIARAIHEASPRNGRTFVKLNCAAIPTGLLESELFGHERGAFTGAIAQKIGRMELANGGTLFLDEVGDIPLELQPKLLRALQEREFERLGSVRTQKSDVRFIAATNQNLPKMVADKQFRSDLFYRLNVFPINIPSLRERKDDIPRLVRYFVSKYATKMNKQIETIPTVAMGKLQAWHWPGNVRELENFIERSVILTNGPALFVSLAELESAVDASDRPPETLRETEREHILRVLRETRGVLAGPAGAAARLGLKRTTLQYKIKKLGITEDEY